MVREIKFRGISQRSGKLVYGQLLRGDKGFNIVVDFKTNEHIKMIPIFKGTQSQYTGLEDVNGIEIYSNDIVAVEIIKGVKINLPIGFGSGSFNVNEIPRGYGFHGESHTLGGLVSKGYEIKVIGNIYINQELLVGDSNE